MPKIQAACLNSSIPKGYDFILVPLFLAAAVIGVLLLLTTTSIASADGGVHKAIGFEDDLDHCAGCHRIHTGKSGPLLASESQWDLCMTCHDGSGARTNVVDGRLMDSPNGIAGEGLRGGGFIYAYMDTDLDGELEAAPVTSVHTIGEEGTAFGALFESGTASAGVNMLLQCTTCHNPHGNGRYRILRSTPEEFENGPVPVPDEVEPYQYEITYNAGNYREMSDYSAEIRHALDDWCAYCHVAYLAGPNSGHRPSEDLMFRFRHMTDENLGGGGCLACHVAHGTSATMGYYSSHVPWPTSAGSYKGDPSRSALLWCNSRSVCAMCHTGNSLTAD